MTSRPVYDQHRIAAARRRMMPLAAAVRAGDEGAFRAALFATEPGVVDLNTASDMRFGFADPVKYRSLAEVCFHANRLELLRIALEARHPDKVGEFHTGSKAAWLRHLSQHSEHCELVMRCLGTVAYWNRNAVRRGDFLELALEYDPESPAIASLEARDPNAAAVIRASRMRLQMRVAAADLSAPAGTRSRRSLAV